MRWINHWQHDVDRLCDRLPLLSHLERATDGAHQAENVSSGANTEFGETLSCRLQKLREHFGLAAPGLLRKDLRRQTPVRLRKADVVELDLAESHFDRFFGDAEIVFPDRIGVGIHPG